MPHDRDIYTTAVVSFWDGVASTGGPNRAAINSCLCVCVYIGCGNCLASCAGGRRYRVCWDSGKGLAMMARNYGLARIGRGFVWCTIVCVGGLY